MSVRNGGLSYAVVLHAWVVFCVKRSFTLGWSFVRSVPSRIGVIFRLAVHSSRVPLGERALRRDHVSQRQH